MSHLGGGGIKLTIPQSFARKCDATAPPIGLQRDKCSNRHITEWEGLKAENAVQDVLWALKVK